MPRPKIQKRKETVSSGKIKLNFDIPMLNMLIKYTQCECVTAIQLSNLHNLMKKIDLNAYSYNLEISTRVKTVAILAEAMVEKNIKDTDVLTMYLKERNPDAEELLKDITLEPNRLTVNECNMIAQAVNERVQYAYMYTIKDELIEALSVFDKASFVSYHSAIAKMKDVMTKAVSALQSADATPGLIREFSFSDETYAKLAAAIVMKTKNPTLTLFTGIRQLNSILSPGFEAQRLYTFLGGTGKFKSGTLLNIADQIRLYNPQITPFENGLRKTILFITAENSIEETYARLYDMYSDVNDELRDKTPEEVMETLRTQGKFEFTDNSGIDLHLMFFTNLEINAADIEAIIRNLYDRGKQTICCIVDYILKIDSIRDTFGDETQRLAQVSRDLKQMAQNCEIPVITAMQLNREGNAILDSAMREDKQDVTRFVGTSSVGVSWAVMTESDWACMINPELQKSTGKLFLTFKRVKIRGKKDVTNTCDYFNHPFTNEKNIRLQPDVELERPLSIISLASDLVTADDKLLKDARIERPTISGGPVKMKENTTSKVIKSIESLSISKFTA